MIPVLVWYSAVVDLSFFLLFAEVLREEFEMMQKVCTCVGNLASLT